MYLQLSYEIQSEMKNKTLMFGCGGSRTEGQKLLPSTLCIHWLYAIVLGRGNINVQVEKKRIFKLGETLKFKKVIQT